MIKTLTTAFLLSLLSISAKPITIDRSLAIVNYEVITLSTITSFYQITKLQQVKKRRVNTKKLPYKITSAILKKTLEKYIMLELLLQESQKVTTAKVNTAQYYRKLSTLFKSQLEFEKFLQSINSTKTSISKFFTMQITSQQFINKKINKASIIVNNEELEIFMTKNRLKHSKRNVKKAKTLIINQKYNIRISTFMKKLLEKNQIKYLANDI